MNSAVIVAAALLTLVVSVNSCNSFGRRGLLRNVQPEVNIGVVFLSIKLVDFNVYKYNGGSQICISIVYKVSCNNMKYSIMRSEEYFLYIIPNFMLNSYIFIKVAFHNHTVCTVYTVHVHYTYCIHNILYICLVYIYTVYTVYNMLHLKFTNRNA